MSPLSWLSPEAIRNVPLLEIDWSADGEKSTLLEFYRGVGPAAQKIGEARAADLSLPDSIAEAATWEREPTLPSWLREKLRAGLSEVLYAARELWLSFRQHDGYLAMMPWEELLRGVVFEKVFRLPYFPHEPEEHFLRRVAIAAPSRAAALQLLTGWGWSQFKSPPWRIDLFLPALPEPPSDAAHADVPPFSQFRFPLEAAPPGWERKDRPFRHPLLQWMHHVFAEHPLDVVVLFGQAGIMENQSVLYTPPLQGTTYGSHEPVPIDTALLADELNLFLKSVGAGSSVVIIDKKPIHERFAALLFNHALSQRNAGIHYLEFALPPGRASDSSFEITNYLPQFAFFASPAMVQLLDDFTCRRLIRDARQSGQEIRAGAGGPAAHGAIRRRPVEPGSGAFPVPIGRAIRVRLCPSQLP